MNPARIEAAAAAAEVERARRLRGAAPAYGVASLRLMTLPSRRMPSSMTSGRA